MGGIRAQLLAGAFDIFMKTFNVDGKHDVVKIKCIYFFEKYNEHFYPANVKKLPNNSIHRKPEFVRLRREKTLFHDLSFTKEF